MANSPTPNQPNSPNVTPLKCLTGAIIAASLAIALYALTMSIAQSFAATPLVSDKVIVLKLSSLVRTFVLGLASLGTFVCGFIALGLILLGIQVTFKKDQQES
ncbi:MAG: DUF3082 domain-containing protein [Microcystaceae cyanobacterium]